MEPSPLVYDTAAAAAVWQRVGPALPAYDAAPCPVGACCPLPRRETDSEAMLGGLIAEGAALYACCRRCAVRAPRQSRQALEQLAREEQRAVRALLAAYFLHTGRWRQPPRAGGGGTGDVAGGPAAGVCGRGGGAAGLRRSGGAHGGRLSAAAAGGGGGSRGGTGKTAGKLVGKSLDNGE